jgi:hypothetical protein
MDPGCALRFCISDLTMLCAVENLLKEGGPRADPQVPG